MWFDRRDRHVEKFTLHLTNLKKNTLANKTNTLPLDNRPTAKV
jgi:hypothetical protein